MNIKQASEQSGVSAPNIRFYEKEGLLTPARRQGNDYRDYTAGDVRTLKLIRMLRMLDVPLPTIKAVLRGEQPLQQALQAQQTVLEQQVAHLAAAMQFCADLARQQPQAETLDVDACLTRMEHPAGCQRRQPEPACTAGDYPPCRHDGGKGAHRRQHDTRDAQQLLPPGWKPGVKLLR